MNMMGLTQMSANKIAGYSFSFISKRLSVSSSVINCEEKPYDSLPGPLNLPFIGSSWQFLPIIGGHSLLKLDEIATKHYKKYGSIVKEKFGDVRIVHLYDPAYFEVVAKATLHKPVRMGFLALGHYRESHPDKYESPGLLPVNDERWWKLRQIFQKPISPLREARDSLPDNDKITSEFINSLKSGAIIEDFMPIGNRLNMELVCHLLFGERIHCFDEAAMAPDSYLTTLLTRAVAIAESIGEQDRSMMLWKTTNSKVYKNMETTLNILEEFVERMIDKVKSRGDLSEDKCIVAQFINNPDFPQKELLGIVTDLLLGGIHTTAITSCFLLYYASRNPEVQAKLREESKRLLPPGASITATTLNQAEYTRSFVKETFRLNPIGTAGARILTEDLLIGNYRIPKDTIAILQQLVLCRDELYFKDALKFKPERWIKGSTEYEQVNPYLVMPFGLGLRSCIARRRAEQNLFVFTLRMFNSGEIKWMRDAELGFITPFMIAPDGPTRIMFTRR